MLHLIRHLGACLWLTGTVLLATSCRSTKPAPEPIASVYPTEVVPPDPNPPVATEGGARAGMIAVAAPADSAPPVAQPVPEVKADPIPSVTRSEWDSGEDFPLGARLAELPPIPFGFDSTELDEAGLSIVRRAAAYLRHEPTLRVVLRGHTDSRGSPEYNLALGERRAQAVREALIAEGVAEERIGTMSFGEDVPLSPGETDADMAMNRRVDFFVYRVDTE